MNEIDEVNEFLNLIEDCLEAGEITESLPPEEMELFEQVESGALDERYMKYLEDEGISVDDTRVAPNWMQERILVGRSLAKFCNYMVIGANPGKRKWFNAGSLVEILEKDVTFRIENYFFGLQVIVHLLKHNYIESKKKENDKFVYAVTNLGKSLALQDSVLTMMYPDLNFETKLKEFFKNKDDKDNAKEKLD